MSDDTTLMGTRAAQVAASAATESCREAHGSIPHPSHNKRGRKIEEVTCFGAKWCICGGASFSSFIRNLSKGRCLGTPCDPANHASHLKNQKNGAFWCILVHGGSPTLEIEEISTVSGSNDASRMHQQVVHLMRGDDLATRLA